MKRNTKTCSCCGHIFKDWKNQDNEGAYCPTCTVGILRKTVKEQHASIDLLCSKLNSNNALKLRNAPMWQQRYYVEKAFLDGILTWKIN